MNTKSESPPSGIADIQYTSNSEQLSVKFVDESLIRLGGDGGGFAFTWTKDDRQLTSVFDGAGWPTVPKDYYRCCQLFYLDGYPPSASIEPMQSYPDLPIWDLISNGPDLQAVAPYYGLNILAVDDRLYQFMSTDNRVFTWSDPRTWKDIKFTAAKLIYSADDGKSWRNHDGSPVRFETKEEQSAENMFFFQVGDGAFSQLSFLQMGKGYAANQDGFVYIFGPNGATSETSNELVLARVRKDQILDRTQYEYFSRHGPDGEATWSRDISERGPIHRFPPDRAPDIWPFATWLPSVAYNEALGIYIMVASNGVAGDCIASEPAYFGVWTASAPWGPWKQIHEDAAWQPGRDRGARASIPQISSKWISPDGRSIWIGWTDVQEASERLDEVSREEEDARRKGASDFETWMKGRQIWREKHPHFALSLQVMKLV